MTIVVRWNARVRKRYDCTRKKWNALLKKQAAQKTEQGMLLKAELEEKQAIQDLDWLRRSDFVTVDDAVAVSKLRGQPLKVIVKVSARSCVSCGCIYVWSSVPGCKLYSQARTGIRRDVASRRDGKDRIICPENQF